MSSAAASSAPPRAGAQPGQGQQLVERLSLGVAGAACLVYLLHSLPSILFPTGLLASLLTLLTGVALGLAGAGTALALAFYRLTQPKPGGQASRALELRPRPGGRGRGPGSSLLRSAAAAPGPTLPPAIALSGEFAGVVYTAPTSRWRRTDTVAAWPPACDHASPHGFRAWEATVAQGTLVLRPIVPPPGAKLPALQGGSPTAASTDAAAEAALAAAAPAAAKVGIPLEGCTVELVVDGLKGRSEFIRRAPLLVRHARWNLLDGQPAFYLWADDPAAKQQWLHALGWWCQDGEKLAAIEQMYSAYCEAMRDRSCLDYPEHAPQWSGGAAVAGGLVDEDKGSSSGGGSREGDDQQGGGGKKGWKNWGSKVRRKMSQRRHQDGSGLEDPALTSPQSPAKQLQQLRGSAAPSLAASPAKLALPERPGGGAPAAAAQAGPLAAELHSLDSIMEAKWMKSRKIQMPPAISEAVSHSRGGSAPTSPKSAAPRPSTSLLAAGSGSGGSSLAGSLSTEGFVTPLMHGSPAAHGWMASPNVASPPPLSSATAAAALPPGSPTANLQPVRGSVDEAREGEEPAEGKGTLAAAGSGAVPGPPQQPGGGGLAGLPEGLPPLMSPDYAFNAFFTRLAFDLLRRPDFTEHVRARIQRQLSRIQRPEYIQTLEVVAVDCGGAAPSLRNLRALPQPEASIWPQILFDMRYQGAFTVTIEMKVDIRDAAAWGKLEQALTRLAEGRRGGSDSGSPAHRPLHAASAPVLHGPGGGSGGAEEEEEEDLEDLEDLEPLSPDSSASAMAALAVAAGGGAEAGAAVLEAHEGGGGKKRGLMGGIRQKAARKLRQLAESTATKISRIPLRLSLTFSRLEGTMCAWVPPPPGDRLFYAFVTPPLLELTARPELAGRLLKYSYHVARVSSWVEQRMRAAITKNMVFPGGGDILLLPLMGLAHPNAADPLPSLGRYMQQAAAAVQQQHQKEEQQKKERQKEQQQQGEAMAGAEAGAKPPEQPMGAALLPAATATAEAAPAVATAAEVAEHPTPAAVSSAAEEPPPPAAVAAAVEGRAAAVAATAVEPAAGACSPLESALQWSDGQELILEPSLSQLPSVSQEAIVAADRGGLAGDISAPGSGSGLAGHLISQRYSNSEGTERVSSPGFRGWAPPPAVDGGRGGRTAADAWDVAMATEGSVGEAPTPKFSSAPWQQQPVRPLQQGLVADPLGALQQQQQQGPGAPAAAGGSGSSRVESLRQPGPGLQLKLAATRSLDPDFVRSAEHTGFGEAPATALPNYGVRRTQSAAHAAASTAGGSGANSARSAVATPTSPDAVGAALSRSLANLQRQRSGAGATPVGSGSNSAAGSPPQHAPLPSGSMPAVQLQAGSPTQEGDPRRLRQMGSFKEQAGKLLNRGKALASQVQQRAVEHAAQRAAERLARRSASASAPAEHPQQQ